MGINIYKLASFIAEENKRVTLLNFYLLITIILTIPPFVGIRALSVLCWKLHSKFIFLQNYNIAEFFHNRKGINLRQKINNNFTCVNPSILIIFFINDIKYAPMCFCTSISYIADISSKIQIISRYSIIFKGFSLLYEIRKKFN